MKFSTALHLLLADFSQGSFARMSAVLHTRIPPTEGHRMSCHFGYQCLNVTWVSWVGDVKLYSGPLTPEVTDLSSRLGHGWLPFIDGGRMV